MMDEILSYDPFKASFVDYEGYYVTVTFQCPYCGSASCRRSRNDTSNHLFQGHFRCLHCSKGSLNNQPFCYYSPVFSYYREKLTQLSLF